MTDERKESLKNTLAINRGLPQDLLLQGIVAWIDHHYGEDSPTMMVGQLEFWRAAGNEWQEWGKTLVVQPENGLWGDEETRGIIARRLVEAADIFDVLMKLWDPVAGNWPYQMGNVMQRIKAWMNPPPVTLGEGK